MLYHKFIKFIYLSESLFIYKISLITLFVKGLNGNKK